MRRLCVLLILSSLCVMVSVRVCAAPRVIEVVPMMEESDLDGWAMAPYALAGGAHVYEGILSIGLGDYLNGVVWKGELPARMNFEVELEAKRVFGSDFFVGLTVPVNDTYCTWICGGWGGRVVGISDIDGKSADGNETTSDMRFEDNRWYRFKMRVFGERIQCWIDGKAVVDVDIEGKELSLRPGEIENSTPLGIATYDTQAEYRNIVWRNLIDSGVPNLVPEAFATAPNYWCTWYAQNYWQQRGGEIDDFEAINNPNAREELNYDNVFDAKEGWATKYLPRGRSDYFFLIDHGWQTKEASKRIRGATEFFSLQMDLYDFYQFTDGDPAESMRMFSEAITGKGWRGLGIWTRGNVSKAAAREFVEWSRQAGVEYWKIDGGGTKKFYSYKIKQEVYPELRLEYITGSGGPLNPGWEVPGQPEYPSVYEEGGSRQKAMLNVLRNTDVFRTYDAAPLLVSTTTMRRTHDILKQTQQQPDKYIATLNLQDDPQVAAGLGCLISSKRHPNYMERTYKGEDMHHQIRGKRMIQRRMNEIERFGRWQRIAPAFAAGEGVYVFSDYDLVDSYPHTERDTWFKDCYGKVVYQSAPAIMARNMPLPKVTADGDAPYVMASVYPNGPMAIATEGRVRPDNQWFEPRAIITVQVQDAKQPIGVFGRYEQLLLEFADSLEGVKHVWGQDLLGDQATDIIGEVQIQGNTMTLSGALIDRIGTAEGDEGDISVPGMVIQLRGESPVK